MVYVGVLAYLLDITPDWIYESLDYHFKGKKSAIDANFNVVQKSYHWATQNLVKKIVIMLKR